jgi:hypothetical protein
LKILSPTHPTPKQKLKFTFHWVESEFNIISINQSFLESKVGWNCLFYTASEKEKKSERNIASLKMELIFVKVDWKMGIHQSNICPRLSKRRVEKSFELRLLVEWKTGLNWPDVNLYKESICLIQDHKKFDYLYIFLSLPLNCWQFFWKIFQASYLIIKFW